VNNVRGVLISCVVDVALLAKVMTATEELAAKTGGIHTAPHVSRSSNALFGLEPYL
jgi:hypothetical protein